MELTLDNLITNIKEIYESSDSKPQLHKSLKQIYGHDFKQKFEQLNLGKFNNWFEQNQHIFKYEIQANRLINLTNVAIITEDEVLNKVQYFFSKSNKYSHRRQVLTFLRKVYGNQPFSKLGFGTFREFIDRHGLSMGYAKRSDFRNEREWHKYIKSGGLVYK